MIIYDGTLLTVRGSDVSYISYSKLEENYQSWQPQILIHYVDKTFPRTVKRYGNYN